MKSFLKLVACGLLVACTNISDSYDTVNDEYSIFQNKDLQFNCEQGDGRACSRLGYRYVTGDGVTNPDIDKAYPFLVKGCDAGVPRACGAVGHYYAHGLVVEQDLKNAESLLKFGCQDGDPYSCFDLGYVYEELGDSRSKGFYDRACDLGYPQCNRK